MDEKLPYGTVVWAKLPSFPWWPAKVIKPEPQHLYSFRVSELRRFEYVVEFFNDYGQVGLCADYTLKPFETSSLHEMAQEENGPLRQRLLKAIEIAKDDLKALGHRAQHEHPPNETKEKHGEELQSSSLQKRSRPSKSGNGAKAVKKHADSSVAVKSKTTLGKRNSSNSNEIKSDSMQDFIAQEGKENSTEPSEAQIEHEIQFDGDGRANRHCKKAKYGEPLCEKTSMENRKHRMKKSSEEADKSMMRGTENLEGLSKRARFKVLMENLGGIVESNVKQWEETLKNADESTIIGEEILHFKAVVPSLVGRRVAVEIKVAAQVTTGTHKG